MPQVYLALRDKDDNPDKDNNYLITQKRLTNNWWKGRESGNATIVNQAGQYSLPGGGMDYYKDKGDPVNTAIREFKEETGINIAKDVTHVETRSFDQYGAPAASDRAAFHVVVCQTTADRLRGYHDTINKNVAPAQSGPGPANKDVKDWEIGSAHIFSAKELDQHLGVRKELSDEALAELGTCKKPGNLDCSSDKALRGHKTQKIDWYGSAAKSLRENPPELSTKFLDPRNIGNTSQYGERSWKNSYTQRKGNDRYNPYLQKGAYGRSSNSRGKGPEI